MEPRQPPRAAQPGACGNAPWASGVLCRCCGQPARRDPLLAQACTRAQPVLGNNEKRRGRREGGGAMGAASRHHTGGRQSDYLVRSGAEGSRSRRQQPCTQSAAGGMRTVPEPASMRCDDWIGVRGDSKHQNGGAGARLGSMGGRMPRGAARFFNRRCRQAHVYARPAKPQPGARVSSVRGFAPCACSQWAWHGWAAQPNSQGHRSSAAKCI
jgi:hypothetical protein